ncbi:coat protein [ssRNA phage Zoerhiza.1_16]|uniref:Coat protein n=2 Tax=Fiersviridae TaxID=2842319 RepID=A0A8S5L1R2_9VIRU|nr:coat protein [ssRNA phage Zoerhiza.1_16]QDH91341.1 MAG: hypothetical protein H1Rhizo25873_000002 [Leviviridae sp.]DAD51380.1 TPA_asm: coat protein [ssRNA phage Zoerhiza.1_16]
MTAFASQNLKNAAGSNVAFAPQTINPSNGVASWATSAETVYDLKSFLSISSSVPSAKSSKARLRVKISVPMTLSDAGGTYYKADEAIATLDIAIPKNMDLTYRQNLQAFMKSVLTDASFVTNFMSAFEGIY